MGGAPQCFKDFRLFKWHCRHTPRLRAGSGPAEPAPATACQPHAGSWQTPLLAAAKSRQGDENGMQKKRKKQKSQPRPCNPGYTGKLQSGEIKLKLKFITGKQGIEAPRAISWLLAPAPSVSFPPCTLF